MEKKINFLVDTNIWLERLLDQDHSNDVKEFLEVIPTDSLFISDFSLHSIGVILFRYKKAGLFYDFINDLFRQGNLKVLSLNPFDQVDLIELNLKNKFDFDDAYQYHLAIKYELTLVTFYADFKRSKVRILNPMEAIQFYKK